MRHIDIVKIVSRTFGYVEEEPLRSIVGIMEECYHRLEPHGVSYVDLYIFHDSSRLRSFFADERLDLGITSRGFEDAFTAQHDAWRGTSRISICMDKLSSLPKEVQVGTIRHEVGHSVLHGSIEYYIIPITQVKSFAAKSGIPEDFASSSLYLISIAVKDYEVARLLFKNGYVEDQIAYAKNALSATEDDKLAWQVSGKDPAAKTLCILSRLKDVCCLAPFLEDTRFEGELLDLLAQNIGYMGDQTAREVRYIVTIFLSELGDDTIRNIGMLSDLVLKIFTCNS
jgi:hypothetical protein